MAVVGQDAIVMGAGMAGLLVARALSEFYESVTVVERDVLGPHVRHRGGVPQDRHPHALLRRGADIIDELFPNFLDELVEHGAHSWDGGDLSKVFFSFGGHVLKRSGSLYERNALSMLFASRPLIECRLRSRLGELSNVHIADGCEIKGLTWDGPGRRITGLRMVSRGDAHIRTMSADLVVDALGRRAHALDALDALGFERVHEDVISADIHYASQSLRMPRGLVNEYAVNIGPVADRPTGMFLTSYENDVWVFTVFTIDGQKPPGDIAGMLSFAEGYAPAQIIAALRDAEPIGEPARHHMPSSVWRRYDKMHHVPEGLLVCGDAVCSFNPIYGQGMTVAALEALTLRDCLRARGADDLAQRYFHSIAKSIAIPWRMNACSDLSFPQVMGPRTRLTRTANWLMDKALTACESDDSALQSLFRVITLIDPPQRLLRPGFIAAVIAANVRPGNDADHHPAVSEVGSAN